MDDTIPKIEDTEQPDTIIPIPEASGESVSSENKMDDTIPKIEDNEQPDTIIPIPEASGESVSSETPRDECSFCFDETTRKTGPLIAACLCSRGGLLVHQNCVKLSIEATEDKLKVCRACNYEYQYRVTRTFRSVMEGLMNCIKRSLPAILYLLVCMMVNSLIWVLFGGEIYEMVLLCLAACGLVMLYRLSGCAVAIMPEGLPPPAPRPPPRDEDYIILPMPST